VALEDEAWSRRGCAVTCAGLGAQAVKPKSAKAMTHDPHVRLNTAKKLKVPTPWLTGP
jgi:hypothetical protein